MKLSEIINELDLVMVNKGKVDVDINISNGYACDLLSQVLASVKEDSIWITIQSHLNIVGVAVMVGIPAIVICEGHDVPEEVIMKADEEGIAILKSQENAFQLSGKLYRCGIE